jgi:hypothetical protein
MVWGRPCYVFDLTGHPKATRAYAWSSPIEGSDKRRFFAVLHQGLVTSPVSASHFRPAGQGELGYGNDPPTLLAAPKGPPPIIWNRAFIRLCGMVRPGSRRGACFSMGPNGACGTNEIADSVCNGLSMLDAEQLLSTQAGRKLIPEGRRGGRCGASTHAFLTVLVGRPFPQFGLTPFRWDGSVR